MSSRKKGGGRHQTTPSQRADKMARKRDERATRRAYVKQRQMQSHLVDEDNFTNFATQLGKMGLQLRDIPGDGNCLFRALGDQLQGHGRNHQKFRQEVSQYILDHRSDFEPFVEDDVPFERHVSNLRKLGTYAGNDAIVAFARLYGVNVVIHQLNSPMWTIKGGEKAGGPELHISYHNGDHYSSVRRIADNTETPAAVTIKPQGPESASSAVKTFVKPSATGMHNSYNSYGSGAASYSAPYEDVEDYASSAYTSCVTYEDEGDEGSDYDNVDAPEMRRQQRRSAAASSVGDGSPITAAAASPGMARVYRDANDVIEQVMAETGCTDRVLVQQTLEENGFDVETSLLTIQFLVQPGIGANSDTSSMSSYNQFDNGHWMDAESAACIYVGQDTGAAHSPYSNGTSHLESSSGKSKQAARVSQKEKKEQAKREKKLRALERHRQRLRGDMAADCDDDTTVVTHGMGVLQI